MKKLILALLAVIPVGLAAQQTPFDKFMAKYEDRKGITSVNLTDNILQGIAGYLFSDASTSDDYDYSYATDDCLCGSECECVECRCMEYEVVEECCEDAVDACDNADETECVSVAEDCCVEIMVVESCCTEGMCNVSIKPDMSESCDTEGCVEACEVCSPYDGDEIVMVLPPHDAEGDDFEGSSDYEYDFDFDLDDYYQDRITSAQEQMKDIKRFKMVMNEKANKKFLKDIKAVVSQGGYMSVLTMKDDVDDVRIYMLGQDDSEERDFIVVVGDKNEYIVANIIATGSILQLFESLAPLF